MDTGKDERRADRLTGRELHLFRGLCCRSECCTRGDAIKADQIEPIYTVRDVGEP